MDNRIFNVNGSGKQLLLQVLTIAFLQEGDNTTAKGYSINKERGMILFWAERKQDPNYTSFPAKLKPAELIEIVWVWLNSEEADQIECKEDDSDFDHDGHNSKGWRVFCEGWGHVDSKWEAFIAIKPAFMWHGK